jgi:hypothetical protein
MECVCDAAGVATADGRVHVHGTSGVAHPGEQGDQHHHQRGALTCAALCVAAEDNSSPPP